MFEPIMFFDINTYVGIKAERLQINSSRFDYTDKTLVVQTNVSQNDFTTEEPHDPLD